MPVPSIKATTFQGVADDLRALVEEGKLSREMLETRLEADDLVYVDDEKLTPTAWVPIEVYRRAVELLADIKSPGSREAYLVARGERAAERLSALGIYSQLDATTKTMGSRVGNLIISVARAIFNFGEWTYEVGEPEVFTVEISDAEAMPEVGRFAIQGFAQHVATRASGVRIRVASDRPQPGRLVFKATRSA